jgi:hypothetical protein
VPLSSSDEHPITKVNANNATSFNKFVFILFMLYCFDKSNFRLFKSG